MRRTIIPLTISMAFAAHVADRLEAWAQSPEQPRFEVTSIKRNTRGDGMISTRYQNGRYTGIGVSLGRLLRAAYQVQEFQIVGGPRWLDADRFDIMATASDGGQLPAATTNGPTTQQLMLRALLAERFNLAVHRETRDMPVYALVVARSDRRLGPLLTRSATDCAALAAARGRGANTAVPTPTPGRPLCGTTVAPGVILGSGRTLAELAAALSTLSNTGMSLNRSIVDRTGLAGTYDFELRFTPEQMPPPGSPNLPGLAAVDPNGASISTAIQEQLGLKLDPQRGPVDVLVIDRVEPPTEN
jgi:uncharacterized protein (TIGR03435 family)